MCSLRECLLVPSCPQTHLSSDPWAGQGNYYHFTTVGLARVVALLPRLKADESILVLIPYTNKSHALKAVHWGRFCWTLSGVYQDAQKIARCPFRVRKDP